MQSDMVSIGLALIEGFALIISPCILPILPIMLAGSLTGSKKRPFGIITGFVLIFAIFTYFSRKFVQYAGIDTNLIRHLSYAILLILAIIMLIPYLTEKFSFYTRRLTSTGENLASAMNSQGGFFGGFLFGGLTAIIWTPCAGPILAAVIVQTVIQQTNSMSFFILLSFGVGAALPMLLIALFGRTLMTKLSYVKSHTALFRKILGAFIILSIAYMIYFEGGVGQTHAEVIPNSTTAMTLQKGLTNPYPAPEIEGIDGWINSPPLQLSALKGSVVLIDFWTYSCINCVRTIPYLNNWYNKYHDKGLIIIGIHTPEFDFEKDINNVQNAVKKEGIQYPVALDSHFVTWQNFNNRFWPAHYLIDKKGDVVYTHFGEGDYDVTENNIRYLLNIQGAATELSLKENAIAEDETEETYLGYDRALHFSSLEAVKKDKPFQYSFPKTLHANAWALQGIWTIMPDKVISSEKNAAVEIQFHARKVYVVMGNSTNKKIYANLLLNGDPIITLKGKDVVNSKIVVDKHNLYETVVLNKSESGVLQINSSAPGLEIYTFTFGE